MHLSQGQLLRILTAHSNVGGDRSLLVCRRAQLNRETLHLQERENLHKIAVSFLFLF